MSEFTSNIIKWENINIENTNFGNNSAKQDIYGFLLGYAEQKGSLDILDLGCGNGSQWEWYTSRIDNYKYKLNIVGYEPYINNAANFNKKINASIEFINNLDNYNNKFDVVMCMSVLEHVYDRRKFLYDCHRACKLRGYAIINFDNGHFFNPKEWKRNFFGKILAKYTPIKKYYQDFVDVSSIIKMAEVIGMTFDDYIDYHLFINKKRLQLLNKCDPNNKGKIIDKIQKFEKDISKLINVKDNKLIHNKFSYSSTLILKKLER